MAIFHQPRTHQVFWCTECDNKQVDSENPTTGKFYVQFGHVFRQGQKHTDSEYDGEYTGVMFALCPDCDN